MAIDPVKLNILKAANYNGTKLYEFIFDVMFELYDRGEIIPEFTRGSNEDYSNKVEVVVKALVQDKFAERERDAAKKAEYEANRNDYIQKIIHLIYINRIEFWKGNNDSKVAIRNALKEYQLEELSFAEISNFLCLDDDNKIRSNARTKKEIIEHYSKIFNFEYKEE